MREFVPTINEQRYALCVWICKTKKNVLWNLVYVSFNGFWQYRSFSTILRLPFPCLLAYITHTVRGHTVLFVALFNEILQLYALYGVVR
jgi:hypothetical protein